MTEGRREDHPTKCHPDHCQQSYWPQHAPLVQETQTRTSRCLWPVPRSEVSSSNKTLDLSSDLLLSLLPLYEFHWILPRRKCPQGRRVLWGRSRECRPRNYSIIRQFKLHLQFIFYNLPDGHHGCNLPWNILLRLSQSRVFWISDHYYCYYWLLETNHHMRGDWGLEVYRIYWYLNWHHQPQSDLRTPTTPFKGRATAASVSTKTFNINVFIRQSEVILTKDCWASE